MSTLEKLDVIRGKLGLSRAALSRELVSSPNLFGHFKSGKTKTISETAMERLFGDLGVSPNWWFYGEEPMFRVEQKRTSGTAADTLQIPILGSIPAGLPAEAIEEPEGTIPLPKKMFRHRKNRKMFALRIRGDSMIGANITEGDLAILEYIEDCSQVKTRDIVAAIVDGDATLKRLYRAKDHSILRAENPVYRDIILSEKDYAAIRGKLLAIVRMYEDCCEEDEEKEE